MGGKVLKMKFDRLPGILRGLFHRDPVRDAARKRRDQDRIAARLFGNQADLIGNRFPRSAHDSIMPAPKRIARGSTRELIPALRRQERKLLNPSARTYASRAMKLSARPEHVVD